MIIYTVTGYWCEDTIIIKSFTTKKDSDSFIEICKDYDTSKPKYLSERQFSNEIGHWKRNHPAGHCDLDYDIEEQELDGLIDVSCDADKSQRLMVCEVYANDPDYSDYSDDPVSTNNIMDMITSIGIGECGK
jgi:hypothetical protein